jgi:YfiH family protein
MARLLFTGKAAGTYDPISGLKNRDELCKSLAVPTTIFMKQVHGNTVVIVDEASNNLFEADALVTNKNSIALAVQAADCLPLLLQSDGVVAAVHVGRKGLLNGVALAAVAAMQDLGAEQITGVVGPHICGSCYEVDQVMFDEITQMHPDSAASNRRLNLFAGLVAQIPQVALTNMNICTLENPNYFSFRRGAESGRQVGVICR